MLEFFLLNTVLISQVSIAQPQFTTLKNQLERLGFQVKIALPPLHNPQQKIGYNPALPRAYGLLDSSKKIIWINPIVFDLQIATPTLIHESVHAAQVCAGEGKLTILGIETKPIDNARPFFLRYSDIHRQDLEKEAYAVQTQANSFELASSLLAKHCR